jgi:uncharacterized membrane protein YgaE (UPF0421/DUF939 family)
VKAFIFIFSKDSNYLSIFNLLLFQPEVRVSVYHAERNNLMEYVTDKICSSLSKLKRQKLLYKKSIGQKNLLKKKVIKDVDLR